MTRSRVHHFPKWLLGEAFGMIYRPELKSARFSVSVYDGPYCFDGSGDTIALAAKAADAHRKKWAAPET